MHRLAAHFHPLAFLSSLLCASAFKKCAASQQDRPFLDLLSITPAGEVVRKCKLTVHGTLDG